MTREDFLKEKIIAHSGSLRAFSELIDMPYSTLYYILKNVGGASIHHIFRICEPLDITADDLKLNSDIEGVPSIKRKELDYIEVSDILANAQSYDYLPQGLKLDEVSEFSSITLPNTALGKYAGDKDLLFLHVNGDSMDKVLEDGALIAVKRGVPMTSLRDKDIAVIKANDGYAVKMFYGDYKRDRVLFKPLSNNPTHLPIVKTLNEHSDVIGRVISFIVVL